jgi:hypothetical protein
MLKQIEKTIIAATRERAFLFSSDSHAYMDERIILNTDTDYS